MHSYIRSLIPLSAEEIFQKLIELRHHSFAPYTDYQVAAIVEVQQVVNHTPIYWYTFGVNVELKSHRFSLHGEQNATLHALALLGGGAKFSKIWIMAASANTRATSEQASGKSCGHCRQILLSLAQPDAEIYHINLAGQISEADYFQQFLPDSFSEQSLSLVCEMRLRDLLSLDQSLVWQLLLQQTALPQASVVACLSNLSPHIISAKFNTSSVYACLIECVQADVWQGYAVGVLSQDIAFLTTEAIFSALGNAITRFGGTQLKFAAIYLASASLDPGQLSGIELEALMNYVHLSTPVHFCTSHQCRTYHFIECLQARHNQLIQTLTH